MNTTIEAPAATRADDIAKRIERALAFATVLGWQEDGAGSGFWLLNLTRPLGHHPIGSTVSLATIEKHLGA